ncbi:Vps62-related protein [Streptomyces lavendulae]|uniref:Vps62-related protein n=1 Tax=Streptomyces lavendulae TaxID=1914 RepID=UPI0033D8885E
MFSESKDFGELALAFTDEFTWCWDDKGTGGANWVSFWHPKALDGFRALGTMAMPAWESANLAARNPNSAAASKTKEHIVALCVKQGDGQAAKAASTPALASPTDYEQVWTDVGSGGTYKGSVWRPVPPKGYVAMGCVVPENTYEKPPLDAVWCVRRDLAFRSATKFVYDDRKTRAKFRLSVWRNIATPEYNSTDGTVEALIAPNAFAAHQSWSQPDGLPEMYILCLPLPTDAPDPGAFPQLTSREKPAEKTLERVAEVAWIPFSAVKEDKDYSVPWKLENSPFYKIERKVRWALAGHINNTTSVNQKTTASTTVGTEESYANTWGISAGFTVSATAGYNVGVQTGSVTLTFSLTGNFSETRTWKKMESVTWTKELVAPPGKAAAEWVVNNSIQLVRGDGSRFGSPLTFNDATSTHFDEYPDPD